MASRCASRAARMLFQSAVVNPLLAGSAFQPQSEAITASARSYKPAAFWPPRTANPVETFFKKPSMMPLLPAAISSRDTTIDPPAGNNPERKRLFFIRVFACLASIAILPQSFVNPNRGAKGVDRNHFHFFDMCAELWRDACPRVSASATAA